MFPAASVVFSRGLVRAFIGVFALCVLCVTAAEAKVKVNCSLGDSITAALAANAGVSPLVLVVKGACTDNVVIARDDVTIKTNGTALATITAGDSSKPVIFLDGAHRIVVDGVAPSGITVNGGTFGIEASRGSTLIVAHCAVTGATNTGIIGTYSSTVSVDSCSVTGNANGVIAANASSVAVTNSTVSGNTGSGLIAIRSSELRVGQDQSGDAAVQPVTVSGNGSNGIAITDSSAGIVVGGTVETSGSSNIFVGRGSSGQIGLGSNLTGGVTIKNGSGDGVVVEGGNATIVFSTITGHAIRGIVLDNGGSARIGITNSNGVFGGNIISGNTNDGVGLFFGASAFLGGNTIDSNGAFGVDVAQAAVVLVGNNSITNNAQTGIFVRAGSALVGDPGFGGPSSANTISSNGATGPNNGGIFAFSGGNIFVNGATISDNTGAAVQAFETSAIELRGSTAVTVPATGTTPGASVNYGSALRIGDTASIVSGTSDGIRASNNTGVNVRDSTAVVQGNGAGAHGVNCFNSSPMTASAATLTGNLSGVTGMSGPSVGCNVFQ